MLVDQAFRRALVRLSSSASNAGVPLMQWRREADGAGGKGTLPRLLQMALDEPALDTSRLLRTSTPFMHAI